MSGFIKTWSKDPSEEDSMTDEHAWIWREMIHNIPTPDLSRNKVLDIGCNQGGFLRLLYDMRPFGSGTGLDLAEDRIRMAEAAKGSRPISYLAAYDLADAGGGFDLAFSHEVIYLIEDLYDHARQVASVLRPGGHYDAVTCCHADNPLWPVWRPRIAELSNLPVPDHTVADIAGAFRNAGLEVSIGRFLARAFIPTSEPSDYFPSENARLEIYCDWKLCFRCRKPV